MYIMESDRFQQPLFIDIETASGAASYGELPSRAQELWKKKAANLGYSTQEEQEAAFFERAAIYAEFGQVIAIGLGYIREKASLPPALHLRSLGSSNERELLGQFNKILSAFPKNVRFCGHNIKEFDLPYLCRRMRAQGLPLPPALHLSNKKPWEIHHIDTMEMWKFGDYKAYTSLDLLSYTLGLPSSKGTLQGSAVNAYFHEKKDLPAIQKYCLEDVAVTAQVYRKLAGLPLLEPTAFQVSQ